MAEPSTVARPYAQAVFAVALAQQGDALVNWQAWLNALSQIVQSVAVQAMVTDPSLSPEDRLNAIESPLAALPDAKLAIKACHPLLTVLRDNQRLTLLPLIAEQFRALVHQHQEQAQACVTSAFPLSEAELQALQAGLERKFGSALITEVKIDPALIGGVRVQVGDHVFDPSVRAQLEQLRQALA